MEKDIFSLAIAKQWDPIQRPLLLLTITLISNYWVTVILRTKLYHTYWFLWDNVADLSEDELQVFHSCTAIWIHFMWTLFLLKSWESLLPCRNVYVTPPHLIKVGGQCRNAVTIKNHISDLASTIHAHGIQFDVIMLNTPVSAKGCMIGAWRPNRNHNSCGLVLKQFLFHENNQMNKKGYLHYCQ